MKILLSWQATASEIDRFRQGLPGATVVAQPSSKCLSRFDTTLGSIEPLLGDVDAIVAYVLPVGALERSSNLKIIAWMHAGVDELPLAQLKKLNVKVTSLRGANGTAVAEHAMAILLGLAKRLPMKHQAVLQSQAYRVYEPETQGQMLSGRTLGIIGIGGIGSRVAKLAKAFDMKVLGVRRHADKGTNGADEIYGIDDLHFVLGKCDYVLISTPITKDTDQFFGHAEVDAMKQGAFLINIARGNLTQEAAVYDGLISGKLAGYGADVWWTYTNCYPPTYHYPVPSRTGLHKLENVLGTGDQANNVEGILETNFKRAIESLSEFKAGKPLTWGIDYDLGY